MSYEKIFDDAAKVEMSPGWSIVKFRKTHPTLLRAIMRAMASVDARRPARPAPAQETVTVEEAVRRVFAKVCPLPERVGQCERCEMLSRGCVWPERKAALRRAAVPPLLAGLYHNACPNCGTLHWTKHGMIAECGDCYKQAALERQKEEKDGRR